MAGASLPSFVRIDQNPVLCMVYIVRRISESTRLAGEGEASNAHC